MQDRKILVLAVAYNSEDETVALCRQISDAADRDPTDRDTKPRDTKDRDTKPRDTKPRGIDLVVVDNSQQLSAKLQACTSAQIRVLHFADNPGFCGGARRALSVLAAEHGGPLPYQAVVLCNTDLETDWLQLTTVVDQATHEHNGTSWILAPDIVEENRRFRANPAGFIPTAQRRRQRLLRSSRWAFSAYFWLSEQRRARQLNRHADSPRWTPMYRPYGAFIICGAGYFTSGGVIHDGPLFNEEEAFARIAQHVNVPILYEPHLRVDHQSGLSYKHRSDVYRQRYEWHRAAEQFYDGWHPRHVVGSMSTWFVDHASSP